jgi:hypothetical protein
MSMGRLVDIANAANYSDEIVEKIANFTRNPEFNEYLSMPYEEVFQHDRDTSEFITAPAFRLKDPHCSFIQSFIKADIISVDKLFQVMSDMFSRRVRANSSTIARCKMDGLREDYDAYIHNPSVIDEEDESLRSLLGMFQLQLYRRDGRDVLFYLYKDGTDVWKHNPLCVMIQSAIRKLGLFENSDFILGFPGIKRHVDQHNIDDLYLAKMMEVQTSLDVKKTDKLYQDFNVIFRFLIVACMKAFEHFRERDNIDDKTYNTLIALIDLSAVLIGVPFFAHYFTAQMKCLHDGIVFNPRDELVHQALMTSEGFTPLMDIIDIAGFDLPLAEGEGRLLYPADGKWVTDAILGRINHLTDFIDQHSDVVFNILADASKAKAIEMLSISVDHYLHLMAGVIAYLEPQKEYMIQTYSQFMPIYLLARLLGLAEVAEFESISQVFSIDHLSAEDRAFHDLMISAFDVNKDVLYAHFGQYILNVKGSSEIGYEVIGTLTHKISDLSKGNTKSYLEALKEESGEAVLEGDAERIAEIAAQIKSLKGLQTELFDALISHFNFRGEELEALKQKLIALTVLPEGVMEQVEARNHDQDEAEPGKRDDEMERLHTELDTVRQEVERLKAENSSLNVALSHATQPTVKTSGDDETAFSDLASRLLQSEPTMMDVIEYLEIKYPHVVVLDSAWESAKTCAYRNLRKASEMFNRLCGTYFEQVTSGMPDTKARAILGTAYRANESDTTKSIERLRRMREFKMPNGEIKFFEKHITLGVRRNGELCIQLYFLIENGCLYIGYVGEHLPTSSS